MEYALLSVVAKCVIWQSCYVTEQLTSSFSLPKTSGLWQRESEASVFLLRIAAFSIEFRKIDIFCKYICCPVELY